MLRNAIVILVLIVILAALSACHVTTGTSNKTNTESSGRYWFLVITDSYGETSISDYNLTRDDCFIRANELLPTIGKDHRSITCERYKDNKWKEIVFFSE